MGLYTMCGDGRICSSQGNIFLLYSYNCLSSKQTIIFILWEKAVAMWQLLFLIHSVFGRNARLQTLQMTMIIKFLP